MRLRERVRGTRVLFKGLLGEAVEGERDDGAIEVQGGHAPGPTQATPSSEVIPFYPDRAFVTHISAVCPCIRKSGLWLSGAEHLTASSARKVDSYPPENILHGFAIRQSK
jgi:hypothetical protein